jgi:hypothetical protein
LLIPRDIRKCLRSYLIGGDVSIPRENNRGLIPALNRPP